MKISQKYALGPSDNGILLHKFWHVHLNEG